jgi:hypothetical protein
MERRDLLTVGLARLAVGSLTPRPRRRKLPGRFVEEEIGRLTPVIKAIGLKM